MSGDHFHNFGSRLKRLLEYLSVGKYQTSFYHQGKANHSSILGGLITLVFSISLLVFSVITIKSIVDRDNYNVDDTASPVAAQVLNTTGLKGEEFRFLDLYDCST